MDEKDIISRIIENAGVMAQLNVTFAENRNSEYLQSYVSDDIIHAIAKLTDDTEKRELLEGIKKEWHRAVIIASLSNDAEKKELLEGIKAENNRAVIIASLSNDAEKKEFANLMLTEADKNMYRGCSDEKEDLAFELCSNAIKVVLTLSNNNKREFLYKRWCGRHFAQVLASLSKADTEKKKNLSSLLYTDDKAHVIASLSKDSDKIAVLEGCGSGKLNISALCCWNPFEMRYSISSYDDGIIKIIASLSSDEKKKEILEDIKEEKCRAPIIASLSSDEEKKEILKEIKEEKYRAQIIASLSSDEKKKEFLQDVEFDYDYIREIARLVLGDNRQSGKSGLAIQAHQKIATIEEKEAQLKELQQEKAEQMSKDSQQH